MDMDTDTDGSSDMGPMTNAVAFKSLLISSLEKSIGLSGSALPICLLKYMCKGRSQRLALLRVFEQDFDMISAGLTISATISDNYDLMRDGSETIRWNILGSANNLLLLHNPEDDNNDV